MVTLHQIFVFGVMKERDEKDKKISICLQASEAYFFLPSPRGSSPTSGVSRMMTSVIGWVDRQAGRAICGGETRYRMAIG
jgi:hypothetical protein